MSTLKQGEHGVSLQEQRDAITRYVRQHGLTIERWFEERETAAKLGRPVFAEMVRLLRQGAADGAVFHKIDRSARNLHDWVEFCDLVDEGRIAAHFATEGLDLRTRGGRLSADLQAVIAADYIRNLREEIRKGFYGRLKQGLYPLPGPIGYLDQGKGKPKTPDPERAPLIREAFRLYASGRFTLATLGAELARRGLRTRRGSTVTRSSLDNLLRNPFYTGIIRLKSGESFPGIHEPLVSPSLFSQVQAVLAGKIGARIIQHDFLFRRLLSCRHCGYSLIGETQKGHTYYRCHTRGCPTTTIREEAVDRQIRDAFRRLAFTQAERTYFSRKLARDQSHWQHARDTELARVQLERGRLDERLRRLTDGYTDGVIAREIYVERQAAVLLEQRQLRERDEQLRATVSTADQVRKFLELANTVAAAYESGIPADQREFVSRLTSNRTVDGRSLDLTMQLPFSLLANRPTVPSGAPGGNRTPIDGLEVRSSIH